MEKELITHYIAKPYKDGYKITRYVWRNNAVLKERKTIILIPNRESAETIIKGIQNQAEKDGFKTTFERLEKTTYITIKGEYEI